MRIQGELKGKIEEITILKQQAQQSEERNILLQKEVQTKIEEINVLKGGSESTRRSQGRIASKQRSGIETFDFHTLKGVHKSISKNHSQILNGIYFSD